MSEDKIERETARALDGLQIAAEHHELAAELGRAYQQADVDWFFRALIEARGYSAELKQELRIFHDRLRPRKGHEDPADTPIQVVLTKAQLPGRGKFDGVVGTIILHEAEIQQQLEASAFENKLAAEAPRKHEDGRDMLGTPWRRG